MTIGSSFNFPAEIGGQPNVAVSDWAARFPNPPDLCFDYRKLLEIPGAIAQAIDKSHRICIVGAGVAGLTAARELFRCGFTHITLIEQSRRVGGRHLTITADPQVKAPSTPFEMGAMRMPFFNLSSEAPKEGRSVMAYYSSLFDLALSDFPNPGTPQVKSTGIYLQEGGSRIANEPEMLIWENKTGSTPPPTELLGRVYKKWHVFAQHMAETVASQFGTADWRVNWAAVVDRYQNLSFRDLVSLPAIVDGEQRAAGDFGGLGMSAEESAVFYSIGIGDGSWGAFYDVCSLYPLRTAIFGFSSHLQLVHGRVDAQGSPLPAPFLNEGSVKDSKGVKFARPTYLGLAALDECLLFMDTDVTGQSPYQHFMSGTAQLLTDSSVTKLQKMDDGSTQVVFDWRSSDPAQTLEVSEVFDSVVITVPSWILETRIQVEGFSKEMLPESVVRAYKTAHWETSCKVYAPLKKSFLNGDTKIPQVLVTDTVVHDVYAHRYNKDYAYDCILLSYTWEDDATKLAAFSDKELVKKCVSELDRILMRSTNIQQKISPFIDVESARVQRWITDKNALGCAKLYRAGAYGDAVLLMQYNRMYSSVSGLYFAGESYSVDAGWTEPAFRGALDAVINICNNQGAKFNGGFSMEVYPRYI